MFKKICTTGLFSLLLSLGLFFGMNHFANAADVVDLQYRADTYSFNGATSFWYGNGAYMCSGTPSLQRFKPVAENLSKIRIYDAQIGNGPGQNCRIHVYNDSGAEVGVSAWTETPTYPSQAAIDYEFSTPISITPYDYYLFDAQCTEYEDVLYTYQGQGNDDAGFILKQDFSSLCDSDGTRTINFDTYYDDEYTPPPTGCQPGYELIDGTCTPIDYNAVSLFYFDNPYVRSKNTTARIDYLYNQDVFTPYDYIEVNRYDSATSTTKTFVATSTIIDLSYGGLLGKHDGQSFFNVASTSTDSGLTYYGVKAHLAAYWDATTQQNVAATTTIEYMVIVDWQDQTIPTPEEIINGQFQATSTTNIFNLDTYSLACTADEWASTSSMPITGWNVDRTVCRIKKWVLDIGLTPAFWIQDKVKSAGRILGNTFPFGLVRQISKSWQDSAAQNLPSELTWLTPVDSNGDLYITMPAGLTGSGTSSKVVLFGDSIFKNGNAEVAAVFAHLRVISKYFLWFGFIWAVYRMGRNIYEELTE